MERRKNGTFKKKKPTADEVYAVIVKFFLESIKQGFEQKPSKASLRIRFGGVSKDLINDRFDELKKRGLIKTTGTKNGSYTLTRYEQGLTYYTTML